MRYKTRGPSYAAVAPKTSLRWAFVSSPTDPANINVNAPKTPNRLPCERVKYKATTAPINSSAATRRLMTTTILVIRASGI